MKKPLAQLIPLLARGVAPAAAIVSSLLSPLALGGQGDLDPSFGDVGRVGLLMDLDGPVWSLQPLEDDGLLFAGGDFDGHCSGGICYENPPDFLVSASGFLGQLSGEGSLDWRADEAVLNSTQVIDVVQQEDRKIIAVGSRAFSAGRLRESDRSALIVFRLAPDGSLDRTFGADGLFQFPTIPLPAGLDSIQIGTSVVLDRDGRIVVAGMSIVGRGDVFGGFAASRKPIVLRLLADGTLDESFGSSGVFIGAPSDDCCSRDLGFTSSPKVLSTDAGGYRVLFSPLRANNDDGCQVVALTADGALDATFGTAGTTQVRPGDGSHCNSIVVQPDDRLLVVGNADGKGFATRLRANGSRDPSFAANAVADLMTDATALAVRADGAILVAGRGSPGVSGALIMRLQANGELDSLFGNAGSTWMDLPSEQGTLPLVHDMTVLTDGRVLAVGGDDGTSPPHPFAFRLLADGGGEAPGVLGVMGPPVVVQEQSQKAVVTVRRTGGDSGRVSVGYQTVDRGPIPATGGQDYTQTSGRLTWEDGDIREQQIEVPIASNDGSLEDHESFAVALSDVEGTAGLGTRSATIEILADGGDPAGQFAIEVQTPSVEEFDGFANVFVHRIDYFEGAVSVTVTPLAGTATAGDDFEAQATTISWDDGQPDSHFVSIPVLNDTTEEQIETFTVELSNPTGGAIVGPRSVVTISISANDAPAVRPPQFSGDSGGGSFGYISLLLLGLVGWLRSAWLMLSPPRAG